MATKKKKPASWKNPEACQKDSNWFLAGVLINASHGKKFDPRTMTSEATRTLQVWLHKAIAGDIMSEKVDRDRETVFELAQARGYRPARDASLRVLRSLGFRRELPADAIGLKVATYCGFSMPEGEHVSGMLKLKLKRKRDKLVIVDK